MDRTGPWLRVSWLLPLLLATALAALAAAALATALEEGPGDETHSLADARELGDGDSYSGRLQRAQDKADAFKVAAVQLRVVDVHVRVVGHDGTGQWAAPPRTTPPSPPEAPYPSCLIDCYLYAGPSETLTIDGASGYYYVRDYSLSACAPVPGTAWYYVALDLDWRWTPNDYEWNYTVDVHLSQPVELSPGATVEGAIDLDARDTHWYRVRAAFETEVWGEVDVTNFDPAAPEERNVDVWVFPDDMGGWPRAMAWDWSAAPNEPIEPFSILATYDGYYYIKLRGMNHELNLPCSYRLSVRVDPVPEFPEGGVTAAYLDRFHHDTDWFKFTMRADLPMKGEPGLWNEVRCFNLTERADSEELPDMDLYFFALVPGGRALDLQDSSFRGDHVDFMSAERDPNKNTEEVRAAAFYNGTYYLEVNDFNNTGFYDLVELARPMVLSDSDNLARNAPRVRAGVYQSHVDQAFDHYDWYKVETKSYIRVQFDSFKPTDIFNCSIYKYDAVADRYVLITGDWNVHFCATSQEDLLSHLIDVKVDLARLGLGQGTYYVCVFAAVAADTGYDAFGQAFVYTIDSNAKADYELRVWTDLYTPPPQTKPIPPTTVDEDTDLPNALDLSDYFPETDVNGQPVRFKARMVSGKLTKLVLVGDVLGFLASPDFNGQVRVRVSAIDSKYQEASQNWDITFLPVNDPPRPKVSLPYRFPMTEDTVARLDIEALVCEVDVGDRMSFSFAPSANITLDLPDDSHVVTLVPAQDWFGEETATLVVTDSQGASTDVAIILAVEGTPDAPRLLRPLGEVEMMEDGVAAVPLGDYFIDPDDGTLSYSIAAVASVRTSVDAATGTLTLTPDHGWYGFRELSVTAVGSGGLSVTCLMDVIVNHSARPPIIRTSPPEREVTLREGGSMAFEVSLAEDEHPGPVIFEWRLDGRLVAVSWSYWLEAGFDDAGVHALVVTVTNEDMLSDSRVWTVTIDDVDRPPVGGIVSPPDGSSYSEGAEIPFVALVYDPDGGTVAYQWYVDSEADGREPSFERSLPVGDHDIRLVAGADGPGLEDSVGVTIERAPAGGHWLAAGAIAALVLTGAAVAALAAVRRRRGRGA